MWNNSSLPGNDNTSVCVATRDRGSIESKCHTDLQEQEAEPHTLALSINDRKAAKLVNSHYVHVRHASSTSVFSAMFTLRGDGKRLLKLSLQQNTVVQADSSCATNAKLL